MDVRLSPEQAALRDSVVRVVADLGPGAVGDLDDAGRAAALDTAVADAGWRELRAPMPDGHPWASGVEVALVAEGLARGPADTAFLGPTLAAELRRRAGAPPAAEPETVLVTADLRRLATGESDAVAIDAAGASAALGLAHTDDGWALTTSPIGAPEVRVDLTRPAAAVSGPAGAVAGQAHALLDDDVARVEVLGLAAACADLVGAMDGATRLAVDYVAARVQYGRPVGSFQAVQHLLADAHTVTEGSRSAALHAAWAVDALPTSEAVAAAAVAKAYAGRSARTACETSIQAHGGIGNTWECLAHVYLRRTLLSIELFGGVDAGLDRVLAHHGIGGR